MNNIKIVIDAGHGGTDPGAVSNGVNEKDLTLEISKYMYERFKEAGIPVTLTRNTDETLPPNERVKRILDAYGDSSNVIVISNHINSTASEQGPEGAEVIYALRNDETLSKNILEALKMAGQKTRNYYQRRLPNDENKDYYFIHRETGSTTPVIIEYGFINNIDDLKRIQLNYKDYVDAVVSAVAKTYGLDMSKPNTYMVKVGDTLYGIAKNYGVTVEELKKRNNLVSDTIYIGQTLYIPTSHTNKDKNENYILYKIYPGDSLYILSKRFNTSIENLKMINDLKTDTIYAGKTLKVPYVPNMYVVKYKDTLYNIARRYNISVDELKRMNGLQDNTIYVGQIIRVADM